MLAIGLELGQKETQMSFYQKNQEQPTTLSPAGQEAYCIPTCLCHRKRPAVNIIGLPVVQEEWLIGQQALDALEEGGAEEIPDLFSLSATGASYSIGQESYAPAVLWSFYLRGLLSLLSLRVQDSSLRAIAFTLEETSPALIADLREAAGLLGLPRLELCFLSHEDAFFQYVLHQPAELWLHDAVLLSYGRDGLFLLRMRQNPQARPVVLTMEKTCYPALDPVHSQAETLSAGFLEAVQALYNGQRITSVFLLGEAFGEAWCHEGLQVLCRESRVFQGTNLYSKGACYGAMEKLWPTRLLAGHVYLSEDKLRCNIGMDCRKGRTDLYRPLLHAGTNWYEAHCALDIFLSADNVVPLTITPVDGGRARQARMTLEGLELRHHTANHLSLSLKMLDRDTLEITLEDKGFGEFFAPSGQVWTERIGLGA